MMRRLAERLLRDRVLRRRMPAAFGRSPLYCSSAGGLKMLLKPLASADPLLLRLADRYVRPGDTVWDIGANIGYFSVAAAWKAGSDGRVFAFEPDAWLGHLLDRTARSQTAASAPITVVPVAVGGATALRRFAGSRRCRAMNTLAEYAGAGDDTEMRTVMVVAASDLIAWLPPPHLVKIDVEGAELEVLRAARPILDRHRPIVMCEVWPANRAEVTALFNAAGYSLHDAEADDAAATGLPGRAEAAWNTLALPPPALPPATAAAHE